MSSAFGSGALLVNGCGLPVGGGGLSGIGGSSEYVGSITCRGCHSDVHAQWLASRHALAFETLRQNGADKNSNCLGCHTTGYRAGGFVSGTATPGFAGVQCESCHGTGARHVATRDPADINRVPLSQVCGGCHTQPEQPNFDEWQKSAHAAALQSVTASPGATDACLSCHSADYAAAERNNQARALRGLMPLPLPSITSGNPADAPVEGVGCIACHVSHGSTNGPSLRAVGFDACAGCHAEVTTTPGVLPHSPQLNLLLGEGGFRNQPNGGAPPFQPLTGPLAVHSTLEESGGCYRCHGANVKVESPTAASPNQTGHRFEVDYESCVPCHTPAQAIQLVPALRSSISGRIDELRARISALDGVFLDSVSRQRLAAASTNLDLLEADGSGGSHSPPYAERVLDETDTLVSIAENAAAAQNP